ncbi:CKLF-like MARVEL transmembrane domain-containing protein 3 [Stigmatopora argus]
MLQFRAVIVSSCALQSFFSSEPQLARSSSFFWGGEVFFFFFVSYPAGMGDIDLEAPDARQPSRGVLQSVLPGREFASSRKGMLLIAEVALSFVDFVCFAASTAAAFVTVPLLEFLAALFLLFAYSTKFNEKFKGFLWPLMDFMRCVTAAIIFFIISIIAISKYVDGSSKAAGVFGFIATIAFALDFYLIFNELANFLKQGGETTEEPSGQQDEISDSDSD